MTVLQRIHWRPVVSTAAVAFAVGVATQTQTWVTLRGFAGVPYPIGLVDFLDTPSAFAALGFAGGAVASRARPWIAVLVGVVVELVAFVGYYATFDWSSGYVAGARPWILIAVLTAPVGAYLGSRWRRGSEWLLGLPLGFVLHDALIGLTAPVQYADARQFVAPVIGVGAIAVVFALRATGSLRRRVVLVGSTVGSALVIGLVFALVLGPLLEWVFSSCGAGMCPYPGPQWPWE